MAGLIEMAEIILKQAPQLIDLSKKFSQEKYLVIPARKYKMLTNFEDAINKAKEFDESVYIVRIIEKKERFRKYGEVNYKRSPLHGKKVVIGHKNRHGLVRCSNCDEFNNPCKPIDFIHESFIKPVQNE